MRPTPLLLILARACAVSGTDPGSGTGSCTDGDMAWNGIMAGSGHSEQCADGLPSWANQFQVTTAAFCSQPLSYFTQTFAQYNAVYNPPPGYTPSTLVSEICAFSCDACPELGPSTPPSPPPSPRPSYPPPAQCGSSEDAASSIISDTSMMSTLRDQRLQVQSDTSGGGGIDRTSLNVFAPAMGMCGATCVAAYRFARSTGIHVTVHCWWFSMEMFSPVQLLSAQRACKCVEHLASHAGNFFAYNAVGVNIMGGLMSAMTEAHGGGIADVYVQHRSSWVIDEQAKAEGVTLTDVFEDLTPFIAAGFNATTIRGQDIVPSYAYAETIPVLRNVYVRDGTSVIGLPSGYDALHLVHRPEILRLPEVGDNTAVTWQEYISALQAEQTARPDRDGDGIPDKPLCLKSTCLFGRTSLFNIIAASFFQVHGPHEHQFFDPLTFELLVGSYALRDSNPEGSARRLLTCQGRLEPSQARIHGGPQHLDPAAPVGRLFRRFVRQAGTNCPHAIRTYRASRLSLAGATACNSQLRTTTRQAFLATARTTLRTISICAGAASRCSDSQCPSPSLLPPRWSAAEWSPPTSLRTLARQRWSSAIVYAYARARSPPQATRQPGRGASTRRLST